MLEQGGTKENIVGIRQRQTSGSIPQRLFSLVSPLVSPRLTSWSSLALVAVIPRYSCQTCQPRARPAHQQGTQGKGKARPGPPDGLGNMEREKGP